MNYIIDVLRENGFKVTPQRLAVYKELYETSEHPNAETLFKKLHPKYPMMSLATVYKTIEILSKLNLIKVINTGEDSFRYDADTSDHAHIKCTSCNAVSDIKSFEFSNLIFNVEQMSGYEITGKEMYFFGICPACKSKQNN